jgi:hypothetical protein
MTEKQKARKLKRLREEIRTLAGGDAQRMIIELHLEGMRDENIASDLNTTGESVRKWGKGAVPSQKNADAIRQLHAQVMFLKQRGITFADVHSQRRTVSQVYEEKKAEEEEAGKAVA